MANTTYPGVYTERAPAVSSKSTAQSSSALAIVGATPRGPVDDATLVGSWAEFQRIFGTFTSDGLMPLAAYIFFQNGGSRLYVVRRTASDAVKAELDIVSPVVDADLGIVGDGSDTTFSVTLSHKPVTPGSFVASYQPATTVTNEVVGAGNGATATFNHTVAHFPMTENTVTISWTSGSVSKSQSINAAGVVSGHGTPGSTTLNRTTGVLHVDTTGAVPDNSTNVTVTYRYFAAAVEVTDNGEGALAGGATGTIDYTTGVVAFTFTNAPALATSPTASWTYAHFTLTMLYPGVYGNDYRVEMYGTPGYEEDATATFSRWTLVLQAVDASGTWSTIESFSELELTDATSTSFLTTVLNDEQSGSEYMIASTGDAGSPSVLSGSGVVEEVIGEGDGDAVEFSGTLAEASAHPFSVTISTTRDSDSSVMTVTDDGSGNLIGDVNASGVNTIDYDTGVYTVTFEEAAENTVSVLASYYTQPENNQSSPLIVEFASGADGAALVANDLIATSLATDKLGIYALEKVSEMMMVALPDFVGTKSTDQALIDWCAGRSYRFALLAPPAAATPLEAKNYKRQLNRQSVDEAAVYYPWIILKDPDTLLSRTIPPIFHVAGVIAKTDTNRNAAKAPAGVKDGAISVFYAFEKNLDRAEVGLLRQAQVNSLVSWPETGGPVVWGANTIQVGGEYPYVHLTRMSQYIQFGSESILYTKVFEPHTPALRAQIVLELTSFMSKLFNGGWFAGNTASEAFKVICDTTNNIPATIARGELYVEVQFAPTVPAEFIVLTLRQIQNS